MKPLNPIMAVLAIAFVGALPLRTLAVDGDSKPAATSEDKNPVNALAKILSENETARKDAGERAAEFLLKPAGGERFVKDGVNEKALAAVAKKWGQEPGSAGKTAMFYFVAGPGATQPGWASKDPILSKTFKPGMKWEARLRQALSDWSGKSQIDKTKEATQASAFLDDAAKKAATVFSDPRTKSELEQSITGNDNTGAVVPNVTTGARARLDGAINQYGMTELYRNGAVVKDVYGPKDPNSRTISMKIYTKRMPDGSLVNEIGIFDITDQSDIFGQRFPVGGGDQSFALDDRTAGKKKYDLKFVTDPTTGDRKITLTRPDGGEALTTSVSELYNKRADQAAGLQNVVKVGGEEFYVVPQGGAWGALALFPKGLIDGRGKGDPRNLVPALYSEINTRDGDGRIANVPSDGKTGPHLGKVGDTEYRLEFNKDLGVWEVQEGAGTWRKPKPAAGPATGGAPAGGGDNPAGGGNPATSPDSRSVSDLMSTLFRDCTENADDTAQLAPELKNKYGVAYCKDAVGNPMVIVIVPKSEKFPGQQLNYNTNGNKLKRARFVDHYMVLELANQVQYLDVLKPGKDAEGNPTDFELMGTVANKVTNEFLNMTLFVDALKNYMGIAAGSPEAGAFTEVPKRVTQVLGSSPVAINGAWPTDPKTEKPYLLIRAKGKGKDFQVWPKLDMGGDGSTPTKTEPYTSIGGGATNAMDGAVSSVNDAYKADFEWDKRKAKLMYGTPAEAEAKGIAMYELVDPLGKDKDKRYLLSFKYKALDPTEPKVFRQKYFEVFNSTSPLPSGLVLKSLAEGAVVKDRVASGYKFVSGSAKAKGVLAVFQNKQVSAENAQSGAANCVGAVAWWGVSEGEALKACKEDKL